MSLSALRRDVSGAATESGEKSAIAKILAKGGYRKQPSVQSYRDGRNVVRIYLWRDTPLGNIALSTGPSVDGQVFVVEEVNGDVNAEDVDLYVPRQGRRPAYAAFKRGQNPATSRRRARHVGAGHYGLHARPNPIDWGAVDAQFDAMRGGGRLSPAVEERGPVSELDPGVPKTRRAPVYGVLYDANGRKYRVLYRAIATKDNGTGPVLASNLRDFAPSPGYPVVFQARSLGRPGERTKIQKIATDLDPDRLLLPHADPTFGAPVVWEGTGADDTRKGTYYVLGGNSRTIALLRAPEARYRAYAAQARALWPDVWPSEPAPRGYRYIVVRQVYAEDCPSIEDARSLNRACQLPFRQAQALAGATQASMAGKEDPMGEALSLVRGLGVPEERAALAALFPRLDWRTVIDRSTVAEFQQANAAVLDKLRTTMGAERFGTSVATPDNATKMFNSVLIGFLDREIIEEGFGTDRQERAVLSALPMMVTLDVATEAGKLPAGWSVLPYLGEAKAFAEQMKSKSLSAIAGEVQRSLQQQTIGAVTLLQKISPLGLFLGLMFKRAEGLRDPIVAVEDTLGPYVEAAFESAERYDTPATQQRGLFGAGSGKPKMPGKLPEETLARLVAARMRPASRERWEGLSERFIAARSSAPSVAPRPVAAPVASPVAAPAPEPVSEPPSMFAPRPAPVAAPQRAAFEAKLNEFLERVERFRDNVVSSKIPDLRKSQIMEMVGDPDDLRNDMDDYLRSEGSDSEQKLQYAEAALEFAQKQLKEAKKQPALDDPYGYAEGILSQPMDAESREAWSELIGAMNDLRKASEAGEIPINVKRVDRALDELTGKQTSWFAQARTYGASRFSPADIRKRAAKLRRDLVSYREDESLLAEVKAETDALTFGYGLRSRPPGLNTIPDGYLRIDEPSPEYPTETRHGIAVYGRKLSDDEIKRFGIHPIISKDEAVALTMDRLSDFKRQAIGEWIAYGSRDRALRSLTDEVKRTLRAYTGQEESRAIVEDTSPDEVALVVLNKLSVAAPEPEPPLPPKPPSRPKKPAIDTSKLTPLQRKMAEAMGYRTNSYRYTGGPRNRRYYRRNPKLSERGKGAIVKILMQQKGASGSEAGLVIDNLEPIALTFANVPAAQFVKDVLAALDAILQAVRDAEQEEVDRLFEEAAGEAPAPAPAQTSDDAFEAKYGVRPGFSYTDRHGTWIVDYDETNIPGMVNVYLEERGKGHSKVMDAEQVMRLGSRTSTPAPAPAPTPPWLRSSSDPENVAYVQEVYRRMVTLLQEPNIKSDRAYDAKWKNAPSVQNMSITVYGRPPSTKVTAWAQEFVVQIDPRQLVLEMPARPALVEKLSGSVSSIDPNAAATSFAKAIQNWMEEIPYKKPEAPAPVSLAPIDYPFTPPSLSLQPNQIDPESYYMLWERVGSGWVIERSYKGQYILDALLDDVRQKASTSRPLVIMPMGSQPEPPEVSASPAPVPPVESPRVTGVVPEANALADKVEALYARADALSNTVAVRKMIKGKVLPPDKLRIRAKRMSRGDLETMEGHYQEALAEYDKWAAKLAQIAEGAPAPTPTREATLTARERKAAAKLAEIYNALYKDKRDEHKFTTTVGGRRELTSGAKRSLTTAAKAISLDDETSLMYLDVITMREGYEKPSEIYRERESDRRPAPAPAPTPAPAPAPMEFLKDSSGKPVKVSIRASGPAVFFDTEVAEYAEGDDILDPEEAEAFAIADTLRVPGKRQIYLPADPLDGLKVWSLITQYADAEFEQSEDTDIEPDLRHTAKVDAEGLSKLAARIHAAYSAAGKDMMLAAEDDRQQSAPLLAEYTDKDLLELVRTGSEGMKQTAKQAIVSRARALLPGMSPRFGVGYLVLRDSVANELTPARMVTYYDGDRADPEQAPAAIKRLMQHPERDGHVQHGWFMPDDADERTARLLLIQRVPRPENLNESRLEDAMADLSQASRDAVVSYVEWLAGIGAVKPETVAIADRVRTDFNADDEAPTPAPAAAPAVDAAAIAAAFKQAAQSALADLD